ncbi:hypothetical protein M0812_14663 [Anaeramoeba flamelloides]|uniref:Endonuclease/exonuclease/phosphatase domain-containing protein n=1 Tax=Anaeramoeba flamelloides TaxID=1746091 RepID=A0AAV7Z9D8_9EUKA|nr:hypothetical protein M0812_14663 [Anaeramoeba flamelloides]
MKNSEKESKAKLQRRGEQNRVVISPDSESSTSESELESHSDTSESSNSSKSEESVNSSDSLNTSESDDSSSENEEVLLINNNINNSNNNNNKIKIKRKELEEPQQIEKEALLENIYRNKEDFIKWYRTDFENPLGQPIIFKIESNRGKRIVEHTKNKRIFRKLKKILKNEIKKWKITTINCHQLREWLSQTIKYSYYRTYETRQTARYSDKKYYRKKYPKKAKLPKLFRNIYNYTVEEIKKNLKISFTHSKKIVKYGKIGTYEDKNFGCIRKVGRRNKLIFKTTEKFLSILEIFSIINNPIPLRILRRGEKEIEIWDDSIKINEYQEIFIKKTQTINQNIKMLKYDQNKIPKFISRGNTAQIESEIYLKIATFNVGGLGKDIKTEAMEMFLYQNNIDIALIQETRKSSSVYLRKYRAISKKSYGSKGNKGGRAILFKPFLKLFITEKLIDHEDIMGINLNDLSIVNCYGRQRDPEGKIDFPEIFKNKLKNICANWKIRKILIAGDFNLSNEQLDEIPQIENNNFKIRKNEKPSRKRNIDHIISNNIQFKTKINKCITSPPIPKEKQKMKIKNNQKKNK